MVQIPAAEALETDPVDAFAVTVDFGRVSLHECVQLRGLSCGGMDRYQGANSSQFPRIRGQCYTVCGDRARAIFKTGIARTQLDMNVRSDDALVVEFVESNDCGVIIPQSVLAPHDLQDRRR